jgi:chromosome segregation ATPase
MDEATRYQSAFAAAQSMGTSQQKLVETAGIYLKTLKEEESKFQEALSVQREKQIGEKEKNIEEMELALQQKGEKIAQLTKEIQEGQTAMEKLKSEISESVLKLDSKKNDFKTTYMDLAGQIESDIQKIGQYLK